MVVHPARAGRAGEDFRMSVVNGRTLVSRYFLCIVYISEASQSHVVEALRKKILPTTSYGSGKEIESQITNGANSVSGESPSGYDFMSSSISRFTPAHQFSSFDEIPRLIHSFRDDAYNRTSFYLLQKISDTQVDSGPILEFAKTAFSLMDFSQHTGTHPTLGSVDHISFQPIGNTALEEVESIAQKFCHDIHAALNVPIFCYGSANMRNKAVQDGTTEETEPQPLRVVRKALGYFDTSEGENPNHSSLLANMIATSKIEIIPDYGTLQAFDPKMGVMCVGAVPYVQNFNVKYGPSAPKTLVSQVTKHLRRPDVG